MIEIALIIVALAQTGVLVYVLRSNKEERAKLVNALVSRNAQELAELQVVDKQKMSEPEPTIPNLTPVEQLDDAEWEKYVINGDA